MLSFSSFDYLLLSDFPEEEAKKMWFPPDSSEKLIENKAHYYPRKVDDDLYFTYDLKDASFVVRLTANLPRHYSIQLFLREKAT